MPDRLQQLANTPVGKQIAGTLGLPVPVPLRRYTPGEPILHGPVLLGGDGRVQSAVEQVLKGLDADVHVDVRERADYAALVYDASTTTDSSQLRGLFEFYNSSVRHLAASSRVLVVGDIPEGEDARRRAAQRALEGFVRSTGKEMRKGATANLLQVGDGAEGGVESTLRFFLSGRSAFVSGQVVRLEATDEEPVAVDWDRPLADQVAVVTGAAQGIGATIAEVLARDGAEVVCLDIPPQGGKLAGVANRVGGSSFQLDITSQDAPRRLVDHLRERHGGVDLVVHNAGITRDKTLVGMSGDQWDQVIAVNLASQERIDDALLGDGVLREHGRIVTISSLSGIAGNRGQTNYAASKAGLIGRVEALAPELARRRGTINAVAPGFIETAMTAEMPIAVREAGRRMNSLNQGGLPVDVAETVAWLGNPATAYVNGNVVRVCGQSLLGA